MQRRLLAILPLPAILLAAVVRANAPDATDAPAVPVADTNALPVVAADGSATNTPVATAEMPEAPTRSHVQPRDRYQVILDRMPFGRAPIAAAVDPATQAKTAEDAKKQDQLAKQIRLCAVIRVDDGIAAGFIDSADKPPRQYFLKTGQTEGVYTLVSASIEKEEATIEREGVALVFNLEGARLPGEKDLPRAAGTSETPVPSPRIAPPLPAPTTATADGATASRVTAIPRPPLPSNLFDPNAPERWPIPRNVKAIDRVLASGITTDSYVERLKQRREELVKEQAAQDAAQQQKVDAAAEDRAAEMFMGLMRRRNMDMIRSGQGSLGIPLTAEEDAQLVSEGVLPKH